MVRLHVLQRWQGALGSLFADNVTLLARHLTSSAGRDRESQGAEPSRPPGADQHASTSPGQQREGTSSPEHASSAEQEQQQRRRRRRQQQRWQSTVNKKEAEKFAGFSSEWWASEGPFKPLHRMNPVRVRFIADALCDNYGLDPHRPDPLHRLHVLDVGCGGGILAESLARLGAHVTGIDVNQAAVGAAEAHAQQDPAVSSLVDYRVAAVEQLVEEGALFDAVIASEVIEHVKSLPHFCASLARATRPGGAVVVTTLNRTPRSLALAVVAAEYVLRWVPAGTHDWSKFLTPEELAMAVEDSSDGALALEQVAGMVFNPLSGEWSLGTDTAINYAAHFRKHLSS